MCAPTNLVDKKDQQRQQPESNKTMPRSSAMGTSKVTPAPRHQQRDTSRVRVAAPWTSHSSRIRSRFLHRLGIENHPSQVSTGKESQHKVVLVSKRYRPSNAHLKNQGHTSNASSLRIKSSAHVSRVVRFDSKVTIHLIPTRHEYSERVRKQLWSDPAEIQRNALRNTVEFAAEGWDWRNVVLDNNMIRHAITGELLHPVHFYMKREFNLHQHFVNVMAARAGYPTKSWSHHHHFCQRKLAS